MRELDLRHLRVICTIAGVGSLSRAATQLGLSQPALTALLHRIEQRIGGDLFTRSSQGVKPTELGRVVLCQAQVVLTEMENLNECVMRQQRDADVVRIVGYSGPLLTAFSARLGKELDTRVEVTGENSVTGICQKVLDGLDFGLLAAHEQFAAPIPQTLRRQLIADEPLCIAIPSSHQLAVQDIVYLKDLAEEDWIFCPDPDDDGLNTVLLRACAAAGFAPRFTHFAEGSALARDLVAAGTVGLFQGIAQRGDPRVAFRPLAGDPVRAQIQLVWRPEAKNAERVCDAMTAAYHDVLGAMSKADRLALQTKLPQKAGVA